VFNIHKRMSLDNRDASL